MDQENALTWAFDAAARQLRGFKARTNFLLPSTSSSPASPPQLLQLSSHGECANARATKGSLKSGNSSFPLPSEKPERSQNSHPNNERTVDPSSSHLHKRGSVEGVSTSSPVVQYGKKRKYVSSLQRTGTGGQVQPTLKSSKVSGHYEQTASGLQLDLKLGCSSPKSSSSFQSTQESAATFHSPDSTLPSSAKILKVWDLQHLQVVKFP